MSLNDYRPVAVISLLMKSFEKIELKYMLCEVKHLLDTLQFAYSSWLVMWSVECARCINIYV